MTISGTRSADARRRAALAIGLWLAMASAAAATYTYDAAGRLTGADLGSGNHVGYGYDATGNITTLSTTSNQATLTVAAGAGGTVVLPAQAQSTVVADSPQALLAEPDGGFAFAQWTVKGQAAVADPYAAATTVTLPDGATATLTATFAAQVQLTLVQAANGALAPGGTTEVPMKKPTPISATPDDGHRFVAWEVVAGSARIANRFAPATTVTLAEDATLSASFAPRDCRLTTAVAPLGGGTVTPAGTIEVELGAARAVAAVPADGYAFRGWTAANTQATFADATADATEVTLLCDTLVTANFAPDGVDFALTVAATAGGTTDPTPGEHTVPFGHAQSLAAEADIGQAFLNWTAHGNLVLANPFAATTTATLSGPATVTANFAADDQVANLVVTVLGDTGGTTVPAGGLAVDPLGDNQVILHAVPNEGYAFVAWEIVDGEENLALDDDAGADTTVAVVGDAILAARFEPEDGAYEGKLSVKLTLDGSGPGKDKAVLANLPLPADLAFTETVTVRIDGFPFSTNQGTWKTSGKLATGLVRTFKTAKNDTRHQFTLTIDGRRQTWSLKGGKTTLAGIDPANGLDVLLTVGETTTAYHYPVTRKVAWKYKRQDGPVNWQALPTTLPGFDPFAVDAAGGKLDETKDNADSVTVSKGVLPTGLAFDPALDTVILGVGALTVALDRDPGHWLARAPAYAYKNADTGITAKLDFGKGFWSMKMSKVDATALAISPEGLVDLRLILLDQEGAARIEAASKTILEYRAPKP